MAGRHANGEGSIYRRKDGRYEAAAYFLTTAGTRRRIRVYAKTRVEVHAKLTEAKVRALQGILVPDQSWRLGSYLDYWLEKIIKVNRRPTTYMRYETAVRLHLKPALGHHLLTRLSVQNVQHFLGQQLQLGKPIRTVQITREVLRSALTRAVHEELLFRNVAALADVPKREHREIKPWSVQEGKAFLEVAQPDQFYAAFLILTLYGLRRGEVLGLRWCDVDFEAAKLHIRQQLQRINGRLTLCPLKTKAGRRDLALLGLVTDALQAKKPGNAKNEGLVFTGRSGLPIEPGSLLRSFHRLCARNNLRQIRLHDLRHSQATLLKKLGVQPRDAQLILGHASVQTTQEIYQHEDEDAQRETLQQVERVYLRTVDGNGCRQQQPSDHPMWTYLQRSFMAGDEGFELTWRSIVQGPITGVLLALRGCARMWFVGRVAVKHSRQIFPTQAIRSPRPMWSFVSTWLDDEPTSGVLHAK